MSSRFRFSRLRRARGDSAESSGNRTPRRYLGAALALTTLFGVLPVQMAAADGNDFNFDFAAADPSTYNHTTGVGGVFTGHVEQLEGGDFQCGDMVVFLTEIEVDDKVTDPVQNIQINFSFDTQPNVDDGVGFRSLVSASVNPGDAANSNDGGSAVSVVLEDFSGDPGLVNIQVTDLEAGETVILRLVLELGCDPGSDPQGNISSRIEGAQVILPEADTIPVGNQTVPLMSAGDIGMPIVTITKTADAGTVSAGDTIGFSIVVTNTGTLAASNVVVTDALPGAAGMDWQLVDTVPAGCSITGLLGNELLTCNLGSLAALGSVTIHVTSPTTAASCGLVPNTAMVTTGNNGGGLASDLVEVLCPDLRVTKVPVPLDGIVTEGGTATFTIEVINVGAGTARNVTLSDTLPTAGGPGVWTEAPDIAACSIALGVLSCNFGDLAPGAAASVTVTKQLGTGCAQLVNTVSVAAPNESAADLGNNTAQATITVTCALLSIAKVADDPAVSAGDQVGFTITVINGGNAAATNVVVQDDLPDALGLNWSLSPAVGGCAVTGDPGASQVLNCTLPTVPANGGTVVIHVVSPTTAASCGTIVNRVGLTGEPAVASITIECPDVQVIKTAGTTPINTGATAAFTIVVTNLGPGIATGVTLNDTLPAGITWSEDNADCSIGGNTLSCVFGTLDVGETHTIHVTGATDSGDCGQLDNTASVLSTNEPASVLANNSSTASIVVNCPDVEVEKTADDPTIDAGQNAGFEIVVTNNGPGTATNVTLTDTLPAGITWTEDSPFCTITGNVLSCSFGDMPAGGSHTINLTGTTDAADCGSISNTSIIAAVNEAAGAGGNNSATAVIRIVCPVYGSDPTTLPTEQPYEPAPGDQPTVGGQDETSGDPGAGTAGTTVPVTPAPESVDEVIDAVIDVVQSPLTLPRTGGELIQQAVVGLGLVGLGLVLLAVRRRRSSSTSA